ncbi:MAG TPA: DinB family protein [Gemmatimonadaceae bacterium]|nr:DinB family protein [Gemmatimonadaceae bacterium]
MTHGELVADEIRRALRGPAWHGSSLMELLAAVSADEAIQRPIPTAHNIWELVLHITSWSNIAYRRITGGQTQPFDGEDWPLAGEPTVNRWAAACEAMVESHERLTEVVSGLSDDQMLANAPESANSVAVMLHGVAQHDAYHGGQIALLRKVVTTRHRRAAT